MIRAIKVELIKAFDNIYFRLVMLFEIILAFCDFFKSSAWIRAKNIMGYVAGDEWYTMTMSKLPVADSALMVWAPNGSNDIYNYCIIVLPILMAIPYGLSYFFEKKNGLINQYIIKTDKRTYYISKLTAAFINGGSLAVVIPFINLILCMCFIPFGIPTYATYRYPVVDISIFSGLYYSFPVLYIMIFLLYTFIIYGLINTICLSGIYILDNAFSVLIAPFMYYYATLLFSRLIYSSNGFSLYFMSNMIYCYTSRIPHLLIQIGIIILGIVLYMVRARKDVL